MEQKYIQQIAGKLKLQVKQVESIRQMQQDGATIPFMARYRKEATGNLDEVVIGNVVEEVAYFNELEKRKETVLNTIEQAGKLTPELKKKIEDCYSATELEDLYLPYKPKRKTKATQAIEKGLEPLAKKIFDQDATDPEIEAATFINEQVKDVKEALQGARDIIAEWVSEHEQARAAIRHLFSKEATLSSKAMSTKKEEAEAQKYRDYFDFKEP
ncbi:MAG: Tex-like N-terminal domain-containing protein, partial [Flavisolibacter sp.]